MIDRESEYKTRVIKEAIHIRMSKEVMNRDEGAHQLSRVYDQNFASHGKWRKSTTVTRYAQFGILMMATVIAETVKSK